MTGARAVERFLPDGRSPWPISAALGRVLYRAVVQLDASRIPELGAGASSLVLARALASLGGGSLSSVEPMPTWCEGYWKRVRLAEGQLDPGVGRPKGTKMPFMSPGRDDATRYMHSVIRLRARCLLGECAAGLLPSRRGPPLRRQGRRSAPLHRYQKPSIRPLELDHESARRSRFADTSPTTVSGNRPGVTRAHVDSVIAVSPHGWRLECAERL